MTISITTWLARLTVLTLALTAGCAAPPPAPKPPAPAPEPIPLAKILAGVEAELSTMRKIYDIRLRSGPLLAQLNGRLQSRGFSRRVPAQAVVQSLESDLRSHATAMALEMPAWQVHVRPTKPLPAKGPTLSASEMWTVDPSELKGIIDARMTIKGNQAKIIAFVDAIPKHVERAVLLTGQTPVPGGIRFQLQAFYERPPARPYTEVKWPSMEDRLEAAGWKLDDPRLPKAPAYAKLSDAIKMGRARIPDLRSAMDVANDFPRWFARAAVLDELTEKIVAVKGAALLQTTPIALDAVFPPKP